MDKQELTKILTDHKIDLNLWGVGSAKTLDHLLKEVTEGETNLVVEDGKLVRKVRVMHVDVYARFDDEHHVRTFRLVETKQVFKDGRTRIRKDMKYSISEKMLPAENPKAAALRALSEELGVTDVITMEPIKEEGLETKESSSYPGLWTTFESYVTTVKINYNFHGFIERQPDKSTYFDWVLVPQYTD